MPTYGAIIDTIQVKQPGEKVAGVFFEELLPVRRDEHRRVDEERDCHEDLWPFELGCWLGRRGRQLYTLVYLVLQAATKRARRE